MFSPRQVYAISGTAVELCPRCRSILFMVSLSAQTGCPTTARLASSGNSPRFTPGSNQGSGTRLPGFLLASSPGFAVTAALLPWPAWSMSAISNSAVADPAVSVALPPKRRGSRNKVPARLPSVQEKPRRGAIAERAIHSEGPLASTFNSTAVTRSGRVQLVGCISPFVRAVTTYRQNLVIAGRCDQGRRCQVPTGCKHWCPACPPVCHRVVGKHLLRAAVHDKELVVDHRTRP